MAHPIHQANEHSPFGDLTSHQFYQKHGIIHQESFILNHQNMNIFTQSWRPSSTVDPPRGLVAMIHGYASESSWLFQLTAVAIAKQGFVAVALDLRGHGRSDGPRTHLPSIDPVVSDCIQVFDAARKDHPGLPAFLYGESLGGAIAMLIALRQQSTAWSGLVLNGAMCGVSTKFKPIWPLEECLPLVAFLLPKFRAIFTKSLIESSYKVKWKRALARRRPRGSRAEHPTFATGTEFLRVVREIERRSPELRLPVLMVHGSEDRVCDLGSAKAVFGLIGSEDKSLKVLEGTWHQLVAESEEMVEFGFEIIFDWIKEKAKSGNCD